MDIEFATDHLCRGFLSSLDPSANGVVLEIGLGSGNFGFEWAAPLGYRCLAVEPLPTEALLISTRQHGVELVRAAMGAQSGEVPIYHGELHGRDLPDISSLNPRWWGVGDRQTIVPCLTLPELCSTSKLDRIALLKIDTEGAESEILSLAPALPSTTLPRIIVVEYGGGGDTRSSQKGGWTPEFFEGTRRLLEIARELGYSSTIVLELSQVLPKLRQGSEAFDADVLFDPNFEVGNLILIQNTQDAAQISTLIRSSNVKFVQSEFQRRLRQKASYLGNLYSRIKRRLKVDPSTR
jgi:FkbM family methyltransferase